VAGHFALPLTTSQSTESVSHYVVCVIQFYVARCALSYLLVVSFWNSSQWLI